jgi:hypothetical protein
MTLEIVPLAVADGSVAAVVQYEYLHRKVEASKDLQFLKVHLKATVAVDAHGSPAARSYASAQCRWETEAHGTKALAVEKTKACRNAERLARELAALAGGARCQDIAFAQEIGQHFDQYVGIDLSLLLPIRREKHRVADSPISDAFEPRVAEGKPVVRGPFEERAQENARIRSDGEVERHTELAEFGRIHVHHELAGAWSEELGHVGDLAVIEARADREQPIGIMLGEIGGALPRCARPAREE